METIYGYIERITYHNKENGFLVARLQEKNKRDLTAIVGSKAQIFAGETVKLCGNWKNDKKYGEQFAFEKCQTTVPANVNGIEKYLGSGLIKGIGPKMAKQLVKMFGESTLDIIGTNPERLTEVEGIGQKRCKMISAAWSEHKHVAEIMTFLQSYNVSQSHCAKIYKQYGDNSIEIMKQNPYCLAQDIKGIGFLTADVIAQNMGIAKTSIRRIQEGVIHVLNEQTKTGHVYYPQQKLTSKAIELLEVETNLIKEAIMQLEVEERIITEEDPSGNDIVYSKPLHVTENKLSEILIQLHNHPHSIRPIDTSVALDWVGNKLKITLADKQKKAIISSIQEKITIITGGPGTGKTTIIRSILEILKKLNLTITLAAPTGRAAKRMNETTGHEAQTIHRLLKNDPKKGGFTHDQKNPLVTDVLILDEASMIDIFLMYSLIKAVPKHALLILVGDTDQLPSVGPGNILKDIIASGQFKTIILNEIFRQSHQSQIITNAHLINQGKMPNLQNGNPNADFFFVQEEEPDKIVKMIIRLCKERIPAKFKLDPKNDVQILSPMKNGTTGVNNLNIALQEALNPKGKQIQRGSKTFRVNDKVMQIANNYDKNVFNGDIGIIKSIDEEEQELIICFDKEDIPYDYPDLDQIVLSYAASVHKSQGSEYPAVIIPVTTQHFMMLQKNLIYTGLTRGKKLVVLIGTKKALAIAIKNNSPQKRYTRLSERLKNVTV